MRITFAALALVIVSSAARADAECKPQGPQQQCRHVERKTNVAVGEAIRSQKDCPPGMFVTGGGAFIGANQDRFALVESLPLAEGTGWFASAVNQSKTQSQGELTAVAICR